MNVLVDLWSETDDGRAPALVDADATLHVGDVVRWTCGKSAGYGVVAERDADLVWVELEPALALMGATPERPTFHAEDLTSA